MAAKVKEHGGYHLCQGKAANLEHNKVVPAGIVKLIPLKGKRII